MTREYYERRKAADPEWYERHKAKNRVWLEKNCEWKRQYMARYNREYNAIWRHKIKKEGQVKPL
jgi:hypothetical protein